MHRTGSARPVMSLVLTGISVLGLHARRRGGSPSLAKRVRTQKRTPAGSKHSDCTFLALSSRFPRMSPDESRVAVEGTDEIVFASDRSPDRSRPLGAYRVPSGGSQEPVEPYRDPTRDLAPWSWSADGSTLALSEVDPDNLALCCRRSGRDPGRRCRLRLAAQPALEPCGHCRHPRQSPRSLEEAT